MSKKLRSIICHNKKKWGEILIRYGLTVCSQNNIFIDLCLFNERRQNLMIQSISSKLLSSTVYKKKQRRIQTTFSKRKSFNGRQIVFFSYVLSWVFEPYLKVYELSQLRFKLCFHLEANFSICSLNFVKLHCLIILDFKNRTDSFTASKTYLN